MKTSTEHAPLLVFTWGNPARGDDALGPLIYEQLYHRKHANGQEDTCLHNVDLLTDFQLQIEHALDLEQREAIVFVDAGVSCAPPYEFRPLTPRADNSYTSHAMTPAAVLEVYRRINHCQPPPAWILTIRGYGFTLGRALSENARQNLQAACVFINGLLRTRTRNWAQYETGFSREQASGCDEIRG